MTEPHDSTEPLASPGGPEGQRNKRFRIPLLPKTRVDTSIGPLFVRGAGLIDSSSFDGETAEARGGSVLRRLCGRVESSDDREPLGDDDMAALTPEDVQALVPVIAECSGWGSLATGSGLAALWEAALASQMLLNDKLRADLSASLTTAYAKFLAPDVLATLQSQVGALSGLHAAPRSNAALKASVLDKLAMNSSQPAPELSRLKIDPPPPYSETSAGRLAIEHATHARASVERLELVVEAMSKLNQTVVTNVLPGVAKVIDANQQATKTTFEQAAKSLEWAKRALFASVAVTLGSTAWQVNASKGLHKESVSRQAVAATADAAQRAASDHLLRKQLATQEQLLAQQAQDAADLRAALAVLTPKAPEPKNLPAVSGGSSSPTARASPPPDTGQKTGKAIGN